MERSVNVISEQPTMGKVERERKAFEEYATQLGWGITRYRNEPTTQEALRGKYTHSMVAAAWQAWLARSIEDYAQRSPTPSLQQMQDRDRCDRLTKALRDVVAGRWCITDIQELIGDV